MVKQRNRRGVSRGGWKGYIVKRFSVLGRPGSDLLFQVLRLSTIGAGKFNGRVRDGIGYGLPANTTRPAKDASGHHRSGLRPAMPSLDVTSKQAGRASTVILKIRLAVLRRLALIPIGDAH